MGFYILWFGTYFSYIIFYCGPKDMSLYPPASNSAYKLPWASGVSRFVAQGNRGFASHQALHKYAWDFAMPNGTPVLAVRDGVVHKIVDHFDGVGLHSNHVDILHKDGYFSRYVHIRKNSAMLKVGEKFKQGEPVALSGMVGKTIMPHLHFVVLNSNKTASVPISFQELPEPGVPLAGRIYTSQNKELKKAHLKSEPDR